MTDLPIDNSLELTCPQCGYDLRGLSSDRCPECGVTFDPASAALGKIPWSHRRSKGRVRSYWRTVVIATFRPKKLAEACSAPVSFRDARLFRRITVAIASLAPIMALVWALYFSGGTGGMFAPGGSRLQEVMKKDWQSDFVLPFYAGYLFWPTVLVCVVVFITIVSRSSRFWFDRKDLPIVRRNRAVAISQYTCAPLAWTPLIGLLVLLMFLGDTGGWLPDAMVGVLGFCIAIFVLVQWGLMWINTGRLLKPVTDASVARRTAAILGLPATWYLGVLFSFFALPWLIGFVWMIIDSFF